MRIRVVFLTLIPAICLASAFAASTEASQQFWQAESSKPAAATAAHRALLHSGADWAIIEPHLPDPATAAAARLESVGDVLAARRFPEDALDYYAYAIARGGKVSELLNKMGIVHLELRETGLAHEMFLRTVRADKKNAAAWNNLGVTEYEAHQYSAAVADYVKAAKLDRTSAVYHSNMGMAYFQLKDPDRSQKQFSLALKIDPSIMNASGNSGAVALIMGSDNYGALCFQMAKTFAQAGQTDEMLLWLAKASERGFELQDAMIKDPVLTHYLKDPQVQIILNNRNRLHKKTVARDVPPPLPSSPPQ